MKESYNEGVASHIGPESCLDVPRGRGEALTPARRAFWRGGKHRRAIELRKHLFPEVERVDWREGKTGHRDMRVVPCSGGVREPGMCGHSTGEKRNTSGRHPRRTAAPTSEAAGQVRSHMPVLLLPPRSGRVS
ncbi:MAG: hypothetical protein GY941_14595, partial [Planctomycetes bacterium]|nr:hypothetical protein [Planctomycetota bacterium]